MGRAGLVEGAVPEVVAAFCWYAFLYRTGTLNSLLHHIGFSQDWLYTTPMLAVTVPVAVVTILPEASSTATAG